MNTPEYGNSFEMIRKEFSPSTYYIGKNSEGFCFYVLFGHPDSFSVGWMTELDSSGFLAHAFDLAEKVAQLKPTYRPVDTNNPIAVAGVDADTLTRPARGKIVIPGSYSDFGYNNIIINSAQGGQIITFDETSLPLNKTEIEAAVNLNADRETPDWELVENSFMRINAEFCTLVFNSEPGLFTFWSHVPAAQEVAEKFAQTSTQPQHADKVLDTINILTSPKFARYLPQKK